jgi:hypothetical protein
MEENHPFAREVPPNRGKTTKEFRSSVVGGGKEQVNDRSAIPATGLLSKARSASVQFEI